MKNSLLLFFLFLVTYNGFSQSKRIEIQGNIISDSISLENIHIINKTAKKATTSDYKGRFRLPAKVNDTLLFSAVQFENKTVIINRRHIKNLSIVVSIKSAVNELSEVILEKKENMAKGLGLPNADKKPLNKLESKLNYNNKSSTPIVVLAALLNQQGGIESAFYVLSGKRKKDRKLKKLKEKDAYNLYTQQEIQKIRTHLKDTFFTKTLKIPKQDIDYFIKFCDAQNIIQLYNKNGTLEIIDIFIKQSKPYLEKLENEK